MLNHVAAETFPWPVLHGARPLWTGRGFSVAGQECGVLDFEAGASGWSEELTRFHEETAGEGTHPIDVASRRRARAALKRYVHTSSSSTVLLEAGCSSGFLLQELIRDWPDSLVIGSDYLPGPLQALADRLPTLPLLRFDLVRCPLPTASVDAVVLLNVLEHIEDHVSAVEQVARVLRPGGVAVFEVPAGPALYDIYDRYLQHWRRYRLADLTHLVRSAGLTVVERSHLGCLVYPPFWLVKRRNRQFLSAPEDVQRAKVESAIKTSGKGPLLSWAMKVEEAMSRVVRLPVGIRCLVVAVKPRN